MIWEHKKFVVRIVIEKIIVFNNVTLIKERYWRW